MLLATFALNLFCGFFSCVYVNEYPSDPLASKTDSASNLFKRSVSHTKRNINNVLTKIEPIVYTKTGGVEGYFMKTIRQREIFAFEGIPYGEYTGGKNRFKPPIPKRPWNGVLQTKKPGAYCLQFNILRPRIMGSEQCLYLNVYTPQIQDDFEPLKPLPVIVFIHGGSWYFGSGAEYGPAYLLENEVILVTLNYRMGILGFLSTGDDNLPGNMGMKDQALAIKWVSENIAAFGGDPQKITVAGHSSGAVSAHLHMMSDMSKPYFQRAISLSSTAFVPWAIMTRDRMRVVNKRLAKATNCPFNEFNTKSYMNCLKGMDPNLLSGKLLNVFEWGFLPLVPIGVVIEKPGPEAFLTETPEQAYKKGHVSKIPWIASRTTDEGHILSTILDAFGVQGALKMIWKPLASTFLDYNIVSHNVSRTTSQISEFYFGNEDPRKAKNTTVFGDIFTDRELVYGIHKAIQAHSEIAPTYSFLYGYKGRSSLATIMGVDVDNFGVTHVDTLFPIFNMSIYTFGYKTTDQEFAVVKLLSSLISNFADKGQPLMTDDEGNDVKIWDPVKNAKKIRVLQIAKEVRMIDEPGTHRLKFWETLNLDDTKPWIPFA